MIDVKTFHESVKKGDLGAVQAALAENRELLDATNEAGQSAFLLAMYYGQRDTANYLLSLSPRLDLFDACVAGQTGRVMEEIRAKPALLEAHNSDGWTPLHLAAFFRHAELASALLDAGANVNVRSSNAMKNTPLHAAAAGGNAATVELLLKRGADANAKQHGGWTALHAATQAGNREMVEVLLANGSHVNVRAENNQSPLDLALSKGHEDVAALLEELGARL